MDGTERQICEGMGHWNQGTDEEARYIERRARRYSMRSKKMIRMLYRFMSCAKKMKTMRQMNGHVYILATLYLHEVLADRRMRCRAAREIPLGPHSEHVMRTYPIPFCHGLFYIQYGIHNKVAFHILGHAFKKRNR